MTVTAMPTLVDASTPEAARVAELREMIRSGRYAGYLDELRQFTDRVKRKPFASACIVVSALMLAGWWAVAVQTGTVWAAAVGTIGAVLMWPVLWRAVTR